MAPEKTDPESVDTDTCGEVVAADTSTVSVDSIASSETEHEPYFEPIVNLPEVDVRTNEEDEEELLKLRCKLFRYHSSEDNSISEWKERGTGDVKILKHTEKKSIGIHHSVFAGYDGEEAEREGEYVNLPVEEIKVRLLMRQDKTLKIRANHYISPYMELKSNCGSDRAWVWSVPVDFADEEPKRELFAVRFANSENARIFKEKFDEAKVILTVSQVKGSEKLVEGTGTDTEGCCVVVSDKETEAANRSDNDETSKLKTDETSEQTTVDERTDEVVDKIQQLSVTDTESVKTSDNNV